MQVTVGELAQRLGMNKSTVSRALRDHPEISETTKRRVREEAERVGYLPNPAMSAIAARRFLGAPRAFKIAVLQRAPATAAARKPGLIAAAPEARRLGFSLEDFSIPSEGPLPPLVQEMSSRGVGAVLLSRWHLDPSVLQNPDHWSSFACVSLDARAAAWGWPSFGVDAFGGVLKAWRAVRRQGYHRIGFAILRHTPPHPDDMMRLAAARLCASKSRLPMLSPFLYGSDPAPQKRFYRWLDSERPDVIIGFNTVVLDWMRHAGLEVPRDIAFAALTRQETSASIAGVVEDPQLAAAHAIRALDRKLRAGDFGLRPGAEITRLPLSWRHGQTLPRAA